MRKNILLIFFIVIISLFNIGCNRHLTSEAISFAVNEEPHPEVLLQHENNKLPEKHIAQIQTFFKQYFTTSYKQGLKNYISKDKEEAFSRGYFKGWFEPPIDNTNIKVIDVDVVGLNQIEEVICYTVDVITNQHLKNGEQGHIGYRYDVVVEDNEQLKIKGIQRADALNPKQTWQLPYDAQINPLEKEKIITLLEQLYKQDLDFFEEYEKAWHTGYEELTELMKGRGIDVVALSLKEENYKACYSLYLSPYKSPHERIDFNWETATFEINPSSTESSRIFSVKIKAEVLRDYENKLYYNYEYLVGLYKEQIVSIQFIKREPCIEQKGITT